MFHIFVQFAAEAADAEEKTGIAVLGINLPAFFLQLATFLLLFLILRKYAFNTIVQKLDERRKTIDQGVALGEEMRKQKEHLDQQVNQILHKARNDADKIIAEAHKEAGVLLKEAEANASRKVDAMLADAHAKIEDETRQVRHALEGEVANLVAEVAEKVIGEKMTAEKDTSLIRRALQGVRNL